MTERTATAGQRHTKRLHKKGVVAAYSKYNSNVYPWHLVLLYCAHENSTMDVPWRTRSFRVQLQFQTTRTCDEYSPSQKDGSPNLVVTSGVVPEKLDKSRLAEPPTAATLVALPPDLAARPAPFDKSRCWGLLDRRAARICATPKFLRAMVSVNEKGPRVRPCAGVRGFRAWKKRATEGGHEKMGWCCVTDLNGESCGTACADFCSGSSSCRLALREYSTTTVVASM